MPLGVFCGVGIATASSPSVGFLQLAILSFSRDGGAIRRLEVHGQRKLFNDLADQCRHPLLESRVVSGGIESGGR